MPAVHLQFKEAIRIGDNSSLGALPPILRPTNKIAAFITDLVDILGWNIEASSINQKAVLRILSILNSAQQRVGAPFQHHIEGAKSLTPFMKQSYARETENR
jgi:hypothetical protein